MPILRMGKEMAQDFCKCCYRKSWSLNPTTLSEM